MSAKDARARRLRARGRTGLTMVEVIVSAVIVSGLALVLMAANVPLSKTSSEVGLAFEMDRAAARFLTDLRRELRQSGYYFNGSINTNTIVASTGPNAKRSHLDYRRRLSFGNSLTTNWTPLITYRLQPSALGSFLDGSPRYHVRRTDLNAVILEHVRDLEFTVVQGSDGGDTSVEVALTLARANPNWRGDAATAKALIQRQYRETIEFLNRRQ